MYASRGGRNRLELTWFAVEGGAARGQSGEAVETTDPPAVHVRVSGVGGARQEGVKVLLIRSGRVIAERNNAQTPLQFTHVDQDWAVDGPAYYRVTASSAQARLVSNPIFVRAGSPGP